MYSGHSHNRRFPSANPSVFPQVPWRILQEDLWAPILRQVGFQLGRFIYLADAAADYLWDMNSAALDFDFLHTADLPQQEDALNKLQQELRQRRYYGSELLASYLGRPHDAYEAQPLTHEAAQELESLMRQQLAKAAEPEIQQLAGGPGFTPQTAWYISWIPG